jgi:hypothetical protein
MDGLIYFLGFIAFVSLAMAGLAVLHSKGVFPFRKTTSAR